MKIFSGSSPKNLELQNVVGPKFANSFRAECTPLVPIPSALDVVVTSGLLMDLDPLKALSTPNTSFFRATNQGQGILSYLGNEKIFNLSIKNTPPLGKGEFSIAYEINIQGKPLVLKVAEKKISYYNDGIKELPSEFYIQSFQHSHYVCKVLNAIGNGILRAEPIPELINGITNSKKEAYSSFSLLEKGPKTTLASDKFKKGIELQTVRKVSRILGTLKILSTGSKKTLFKHLHFDLNPENFLYIGDKKEISHFKLIDQMNFNYTRRNCSDNLFFVDAFLYYTKIYNFLKINSDLIKELQLPNPKIFEEEFSKRKRLFSDQIKEIEQNIFEDFILVFKD